MWLDQISAFGATTATIVLCVWAAIAGLIGYFSDGLLRGVLLVAFAAVTWFSAYLWTEHQPR
jgi:uncharacterized membrane protein (UPF0136 family)